MEARCQINGMPIHVTDATLESLNTLLMQMPLCEEKYNQQTGQYSYPANPNKHLQLEAVFELKSKIVVS